MTDSLQMRALIVDVANGPLRLVSIPRPVPGPGQVLVRIKASGVNPLDGKIRSGQAAHARQPLPAVLGMDLAGTIEALGEGVSGWLPGDESTRWRPESAVRKVRLRSSRWLMRVCWRTNRAI